MTLLTCAVYCLCVLQGTAVFWYNLFPSGEGDYSTRHAACPVLVGNKWGEFFFVWFPIKLSIKINIFAEENVNFKSHNATFL